jgi:hypothetical protein
MSKEKPNDDPRQQTDWKVPSRPITPGRDRRKKNSNGPDPLPIWKNGTRPTHTEGEPLYGSQ